MRRTARIVLELEVNIHLDPHWDGYVHASATGLVSGCFHDHQEITEILRKQNRASPLRCCLPIGNASIPKEFDHCSDGQGSPELLRTFTTIVALLPLMAFCSSMPSWPLAAWALPNRNGITTQTNAAVLRIARRVREIMELIPAFREGIPAPR